MTPHALDTRETRLSEHGFEIVRGLAGGEVIEEMRSALGEMEDAGRRLALDGPAVATLLTLPAVRQLLDARLGGGWFAVRAIFFDKSREANWRVPWHQDLMIAVRERLEAPGFGAWSMKDGVPHVLPPAEILAGMLTLRLSLDDCDAGNGALRVIPGTHAMGRVADGDIAALREARGEVLCEMKAGDALLMRPLLLHASSRTADQRRRRVLHVEFAREELPAPLNWARQMLDGPGGVSSEGSEARYSL